MQSVSSIIWWVKSPTKTRNDGIFAHGHMTSHEFFSHDQTTLFERAYLNREANGPPNTYVAIWEYNNYGDIHTLMSQCILIELYNTSQPVAPSAAMTTKKSQLFLIGPYLLENTEFTYIIIECFPVKAT